MLPFGSIASVTAFLRVSLALWKVGSTLLHLLWSVYFDNFLCLTRRSESKHVEFCVTPFSHFRDGVLGLQHTLQSPGSAARFETVRCKLCFVTNTEERVEELVRELDEALRTKMLPRSEGEKLRGRLQFASSQVFGRKFRRLLKVLSNHVTQGSC